MESLSLIARPHVPPPTDGLSYCGLFLTRIVWCESSALSLLPVSPPPYGLAAKPHSSVPHSRLSVTSWCVHVILHTHSPGCDSSPLLAAASSCTRSSLYLVCIALVVGLGPFMCIVSIYKKGLPCTTSFIPNSLSALGNESVISISHTSIFLYSIITQKLLMYPCTSQFTSHFFPG